ncbi:hypothetical protein ACVIW2_008856 [Bradyrhizobium huanghuaihaiense]
MRDLSPDIAEPVIGRRFAPTRWLATPIRLSLAAPAPTRIFLHGRSPGSVHLPCVKHGRHNRLLA